MVVVSNLFRNVHPDPWGNDETNMFSNGLKLKVVRDSHWIQGPRYKKKSPGSRRDRGEVPIGVWEKQVMSPNP